MTPETRYPISDTRTRRRSHEYRVSSIKYLNSGVSIVEILIIIPIIGLTIFSVYQLISLSLSNNENQARRLTSVALAQEGIEATRLLRDASWTDNIASSSVATPYYLLESNGVVSLTATNPGAIDGVFTREIVFNTVLRDGNDNIADSGTADDNTRRLTVTVTWEERGQNREVELATYLTNFQDS